MHSLIHKKKIISLMKINKYRVVGIMSGTSCDGLDIAYCDFWKKKNNWFYKLKCCESIEYEGLLKNKLIECYKMSGMDLKKLDIELGNFITEKTNEFITKYRIDPDLISTHGHTVFHDIEEKISHQIGNPFVLYEKIKKPVIYNFREIDVISGGQGAPLVPYGDLKLFKEYDYCVNIGGILNITENNKNNLIAYDVCPANIILNYYSRKIGFDYDKDGKVSGSGNIDLNILKKLNSIKYYKNKGPKSLDVQKIEKLYFPLLKKYTPKNILRTFIDHVGYQLNKAIKKNKSKILLTGGGAFNKTLLKSIEKYNNNNHLYILPNKNLINFKESIIFGFLGLKRYLNKKNIEKSVTGAKQSSSSGIVIENKFF